PLTDADKTLLAAADALYVQARENMDRQAIKHYLDAVWAVVADANRYFAGEAPWAKRRSDPDRMATILYRTAEVGRQVARLAPPGRARGGGQAPGRRGTGPGAGRFGVAGRGGAAGAGTRRSTADGCVPALPRARRRVANDEQGRQAENATQASLRPAITRALGADVGNTPGAPSRLARRIAGATRPRAGRDD